MKSYILNTGRTAKQGIALGEGKNSQGYVLETTTIELNKSEMEKLVVQEGDYVQVISDTGLIKAKVRWGDLPDGMVFIPYGTEVNKLIASTTNGSGMPSSKGINVQVIPWVKDKVGGAGNGH